MCKLLHNWCQQIIDAIQSGKALHTLLHKIYPALKVGMFKVILYSWIGLKFDVLFTLQDKDWQVMECVLVHLPLLLQNKSLVLSTKRNMVDVLCQKLCSMVINIIIYVQRNLSKPNLE